MNSTRRLRRFFSPQPIQKKGQVLCLEATETHHLRNVMRLKVGSRFLLIDGVGQEAEAEMIAFPVPDRTEVRVRQVFQKKAAFPKLRMRVVQAIGKKGVTEFLIEKSQELAVEAFWPVLAERSRVRYAGSAREKVLARWRKKAVGAAKQSGAARLVHIAAPLRFEKAVEAIMALGDNGNLRQVMTFFHPSEDGMPFKAWLEALRQIEKEGKVGPFCLNLFFGPEGGFSAAEIKSARERLRRFTPQPFFVSLGPQTLRMETAALGVIAALRFLWEDFPLPSGEKVG